MGDADDCDLLISDIFSERKQFLYFTKRVLTDTASKNVGGAQIVAACILCMI